MCVPRAMHADTMLKGEMQVVDFSAQPMAGSPGCCDSAGWLQVEHRGDNKCTSMRHAAPKKPTMQPCPTTAVLTSEHAAAGPSGAQLRLPAVQPCLAQLPQHPNRGPHTLAVPCMRVARAVHRNQGLQLMALSRGAAHTGDCPKQPRAFYCSAVPLQLHDKLLKVQSRLGRSIAFLYIYIYQKVLALKVPTLCS